MMRRYEPRAIQPLPHWHWRGWRLKVYAILEPRRAWRDELLEAAREVAAKVLGGAASRTAHHGIGFVGLHCGAGADVVFVDWWAAENELHHHVYVAEPGRADTLRPRDPSELTACVWDLEVLAFERDAWVRWVLEPPDRPRWEEYLASQLERKV